jgi:hypothetical protein
MWGVRSVNVVDSVRREREKKVDGISDRGFYLICDLNFINLCQRTSNTCELTFLHTAILKFSLELLLLLQPAFF